MDEKIADILEKYSQYPKYGVSKKVALKQIMALIAQSQVELISKIKRFAISAPNNSKQYLIPKAVLNYLEADIISFDECPNCEAEAQKGTK